MTQVQVIAGRRRCSDIMSFRTMSLRAVTTKFGIKFADKFRWNLIRWLSRPMAHEHELLSLMHCGELCRSFSSLNGSLPAERVAGRAEVVSCSIVQHSNVMNHWSVCDASLRILGITMCDFSIRCRVPRVTMRGEQRCSAGCFLPIEIRQARDLQPFCWNASMDLTHVKMLSGSSLLGITNF